MSLPTSRRVTGNSKEKRPQKPKFLKGNMKLNSIMGDSNKKNLLEEMEFSGTTHFWKMIPLKSIREYQCWQVYLQPSKKQLLVVAKHCHSKFIDVTTCYNTQALSVK